VGATRKNLLAVSACGPYCGVTSPRTILDLRVSFGVGSAPLGALYAAPGVLLVQRQRSDESLTQVFVMHEGFRGIH
jgi:hypothetical protein